MRTFRHQMGVQDRQDHRLESRPLADDLHPSSDLAPQRLRMRVRHPDLWQEAADLRNRHDEGSGGEARGSANG